MGPGRGVLRRLPCLLVWIGDLPHLCGNRGRDAARPPTPCASIPTSRRCVREIYVGEFSRIIRAPSVRFVARESLRPSGCVTNFHLCLPVSCASSLVPVFFALLPPAPENLA